MKFRKSICEFGAHSSESVLQTGFIQNALDACRDAGGGEVVVPSGRYLTGSIRLYDNTTLHLQENAVLIGSINPSDYTDYAEETTLGYLYQQEYIDLWHLPPHYVYALVCATNAKNVSIIGEAGAGFHGQNCRDEAGEEGFRGPMGIRLCRCENVVLDNYYFQDCANWAHQIDSCHNVLLKNISIYAGHDGIDIHHCINVDVNGCDIQSGDDCIAGYDTYNFHMADCRLNTACNSLRIGCVNMLIENCIFYGPARYPHRISGRHNTLYAFEYYSHGADTVRDNSRNWVIKNCSFHDIDALIHYEFGDKIHLQESTPLEDISFYHVTVDNLRKASVFKGKEGMHAVMKFSDCDITYMPDAEEPACILTNAHADVILENTAVRSGSIPFIHVEE